MRDAMKELLIFAGTTEGRELAETLSVQGIPCVVSVATEYGEALMCETEGVRIRTGRMDEREMETFLESGDFRAVVDATHPYAVTVSKNIRESAEHAGIPYIRLKRDTTDGSADPVCYFPDMASCGTWLKKQQGHILLSTGSKELSAFMEALSDAGRVYARVLPSEESLELCRRAGVENSHIIAMQGPFSRELNEAIFRQYHIDYLVTKQSGAAGGYSEKLEAAAAAGVTTLVIGNPDELPGYSMEEVLQKVCKMYGKELMESSAEGCHLSLIGMGMGNPDTMTGEAAQALKQAELVFGARRLLESYHGNSFCVEAYLAEEILPYLKAHPQVRHAAVLFSGDTGFYSGASAFYQACKEWDYPVKVSVYPGLSCVSYLCSRVGMSWQDMKILSIHGRKANVVDAVARYSKVFLLLSGSEDVRRVGILLGDRGYGDVKCILARNLSYDSEQIQYTKAEDLSNVEGEGIYCMILCRVSLPETSMIHGLPDDSFIRGKTPMTKEEVREVSICKLRLTENAVLYDIGSGTGSVAVECAGISDGIQVYALEYKPEALSLIRQNRDRFSRENITVVETKAPDGWEDLPIPTHAFIGGSGGNLRKILEGLYRKNPTMRVVANAITLETLSQLQQAAQEMDVRDAEFVQLSVNRDKSAGDYHLMQAENPVYIVSFSFGGGL
ncbi:MAG: precorrin-6A reductase [Roseburia sp.]